MCFYCPSEWWRVGQSNERKVMTVRSGKKAFRAVFRVVCFGRSSGGSIVRFSKTLLSMSPLTDESSEQFEICDQETFGR